MRHGPKALYDCYKFGRPARDALFYGTMLGIPRAYSLSNYDPSAVNPLQNLGVSGNGISRRSTTLSKPTVAIVLLEHDDWNMLGRWIPARVSPVGWRNLVTTGGPYTDRARHSQGRRSNFLLADGHVEALDWAETATKPDGTVYHAGPDFSDTMWDAGK
jgi:prepilin-type processing-associated H-X9-DG protein